ncbi:MAG: hypothetical protein AB7O73_05260 [Bacteroidia bacterium]
MKKVNYLVAIALSGLVIAGCGDSDNKTDDMDMNADTTSIETNISTPVSETFFQVPSPGEMLTFIKMVGGKNNKNTSFLNKPENSKNYNDSKAKAINFGIYSCDLSYCSIFDIGSEALKYFKNVKSMGDEIGVSTAVSPDILKRLEGNLGNADSLAVITDDIYFSSFEALEDGQQGPTLALVVAGGWIESLFIATQLSKYEEGSPVIERLADQKYTLENLIEFLKKHESDANVAAVKADFDGLLGIYKKLEEKDVASKDGKGEAKTMLIGGGTQLVMTKEIYTSIVDKVKEIRNGYTLTK